MEKVSNKEKNNEKNPLSERNRIKKTSEYIGKVEKSWRKDENKVLAELSKITGLKWKEKSLICYIVWLCKGMSLPLTVRVYDDTNDFVDSLIHELIHYLLVDGNNSELSMKARNYFNKRYRDENQNVIHHILLFAIMQHVYLRFYNMERLERHANIHRQFSSDYARAWQIVQKEGYQNIIREFRKRIE